MYVMQLLEKHKTMDSMVELLELYEEEDQAYGGLLEASTQLYQYLLQPFRDMRELAMLRRQQIKVRICSCLSLPLKCIYKHKQVFKKSAPQETEKRPPLCWVIFLITTKLLSLKQSLGPNPVVTQ